MSKNLVINDFFHVDVVGIEAFHGITLNILCLKWPNQKNVIKFIMLFS